MRRKIWLAALVALSITLTLFGAGVVLAEYSLRRSTRALLPELEQLAHQRAAAVPAKLENVSLETRDKVNLQGWLLTPERWNGDTVIALHGVTDNRLGIAGYAELFAKHGYQVLLTDARGHGASDGRLMTYGVLDAADVREWAEFVRARSKPGCVYGFGESMGAAIILQALREDPALCAVVAESPFSDFELAAFDRLESKFEMRPGTFRWVLVPVVKSALLYSEWQYELDLRKASPREAVRDSTVPVLLIHGVDDVNLRVENSRRIAAARSKDLQLWEVPGAKHCEVWKIEPEEFERRVLSWFKEHRN